jgi:enoyl-CoA hydratase/carnithine racemase
MTEHLLIEKADGVLTLTMNRPEKKNAMNRALNQALAQAIADADKDPDVRCVLIQGNGDVFSSGVDISDFAEINASETGISAHEVKDALFLRALTESKTPLVSAVQGRAMGVAVTLVLHSDLVFMTEDALLITPFVNLGLVPEGACSLILTERIGYVRAFSMLVLGEPIDGKTAVAWGLANAAVPADQLRARARAAAEAIAARAPAAVSNTKVLMRESAKISARIAEESEHFATLLSTKEAGEAFRAFTQRRA